MKNLIALTILSIFLSGCDLFLKECSEIYGTIEDKCIPTENLNLNSHGGNIAVAIDIANRTTFTHVESYCSSSCVMISSRGEHRSACHDAVFGLHQGSILGSNPSQTATDMMKRFYTEDDRINSDWTNFWIDMTPNKEMYKFSAYTAKAVGLIDQIVECN